MTGCPTNPAPRDAWALEAALDFSPHYDEMEDLVQSWVDRHGHGGKGELQFSGGPLGLRDPEDVDGLTVDIPGVSVAEIEELAGMLAARFGLPFTVRRSQLVPVRAFLVGENVKAGDREDRYTWMDPEIARRYERQREQQLARQQAEGLN